MAGAVGREWPETLTRRSPLAAAAAGPLLATAERCPAAPRGQEERRQTEAGQDSTSWLTELPG
jgi:hypothetical protein